MNKKGSAGDNLASWYLLYLIILVVFFVLAFYYITAYQDGAALWEDFYSKQVVRMIDNAKPGDEFHLDVSVPSKIAFKKGYDVQKIFDFDNVNNQVIVKLSTGQGTSFGYFNNVDVVDWKVELPSGDPNSNRLYFKVVDVQK